MGKDKAVVSSMRDGRDKDPKGLRNYYTELELGGKTGAHREGREGIPAAGTAWAKAGRRTGMWASTGVGLGRRGRL